jgi:hypothetical protein
MSKRTRTMRLGVLLQGNKHNRNIAQRLPTTLPYQLINKAYISFHFPCILAMASLKNVSKYIRKYQKPGVKSSIVLL